MDELITIKQQLAKIYEAVNRVTELFKTITIKLDQLSQNLILIKKSMQAKFEVIGKKVEQNFARKSSQKH